MQPVNLPEICYRIIRQVMRIKKGQIVLIGGNIHNYGSYDPPLCELPLIEELAVNIRKIGAYPILEFSLSNLMKRYFNEIPPEIMEQSAGYYEKWLSYVDAIIDIGWQTTPKLFSQIPKDKLMYSRESVMPKIIDVLKQKSTKILLLGYPSKEKALHYNLYTTQFQQLFWDSLTIDSQKINLVSQKIRETFFNSANLKLSGPKFDDITFEVNKRSFVIENGIMEEEFSFLSVPFGEFIVKPKLETMTGKIFFNYVSVASATFKDVTIEFKEGKIINISTPTSEEVLRKVLSFESSDNRVIESIGVGLNNRMNEIVNFVPFDRKMSGSITFNVGNSASGGINSANSLMECLLTNAYLDGDTEEIVKNGKLKVE